MKLPRPKLSDGQQKTIDYALMILGPSWLTFQGIETTRVGFQRHDAWGLGIGIGSLIIAALLLGLLSTKRAHRRGFEAGIEVATQGFQMAASQYALHAALVNATLERYGFICDVCGGRDEEEEMEVGGRPGPGDPPAYFEVWVRDKAHADLDQYPPTNVISTGDIPEPAE